MQKVRGQWQDVAIMHHTRDHYYYPKSTEPSPMKEPSAKQMDWSWYGWQDRDRRDEWDWRYGDHREWEDRRGDRQGRDDYYEDYHYGGSRGDRQGWDDYYEDRHQDYYEDRRWEYHREDDRSGWRDWGDRPMSGMVGRAGVADVDCLAKVRWLTQ